MENHGSKRSSNRLKRKPFSDLTNTPSLSLSTSTSSPLSLLNPKSKPKSNSKPSDPNTNPSPSSNPGEISVRSPSTPTVDSRDRENPGDRTVSTSTPKSKEISLVSGEDSINFDKSKISTVYTRKIVAQRKGKRKVVELASTLSCPPVERIRNTEDNDADFLKSFSVPCAKNKKQHCAVPKELQKPILPEDFVTKQRAYFEEIDAFELPEEEVSDSELE